ILAASCTLCLLLTPLARILAWRFGLVDRPDVRRKLHGRVIPVVGGIVVLVSSCVVLGVAYLLRKDQSNPLDEDLLAQSYPLLGLLLGCLALGTLGVID